MISKTKCTSQARMSSIEEWAKLKTYMKKLRTHSQAPQQAEDRKHRAEISQISKDNNGNVRGNKNYQVFLKRQKIHSHRQRSQ